MRKTTLFAAAVSASLSFAASWLGACGGSEATTTSSTSSGSGGSSSASSGTGTGGAGGNGPVSCGTNTCQPSGIMIGTQNIAFPACCPPDAPTTCGVDTTVVHDLLPAWMLKCLQVGAPGTPDATCPDRMLKNPNDGTKMIPLAGCCLKNGICGVVTDLTSVPGPNLGCIDPTPFLSNGEVSPPCGGDGGTGDAGDGG